jgi:hypothetical protein
VGQKHLLAILEHLNKATSVAESKLKGENESPKLRAEAADDVNPESRDRANPLEMPEGARLEEEKKSSRKPLIVCAISEAELNKVDLAYFKRPLPPKNSLILSDK